MLLLWERNGQSRPLVQRNSPPAGCTKKVPSLAEPAVPGAQSRSYGSVRYNGRTNKNEPTSGHIFPSSLRGC